MKKIKDWKEKIILISVIYTIGLLFGITFYLLKAFRRIRIEHKERFPRNQRGILVVSNHPSLLEPILLPHLFFSGYIRHPLSLSPWSVADKSNYYDKWYWKWLRVRLIAIDRESDKESRAGFRKLKEILKSGANCVLFPEGGRTCSGNDFVYSPKGKRIRVLKRGVSLLIIQTNPLVVPVWIKGTDKVLPNKKGKLYGYFPRFWRVSTIKIGEPIRIDSKDKNGVTGILMSALLKLADEE